MASSSGSCIGLSGCSVDDYGDTPVRCWTVSISDSCGIGGLTVTCLATDYGGMAAWQQLDQCGTMSVTMEQACDGASA
jgi:hypothetical protein